MPKVRDAFTISKSTSLHRIHWQHQKFVTDGLPLFVEKYGQLLNLSQDGQLAMRDVLCVHLSRVARDTGGIPVKLYLFTRFHQADEPKTVVIDPYVSFGRPVLVGTGIPTAVIAERYKAGESIQALAEDYERPLGDIEEAIRCELTHPSRIEPLIFFLDRSLGKHIVANALRQAGAVVKLHDDHFPQDARDEEWLREVGRREWIVLTKDSRIRHRAHERISPSQSRSPGLCACEGEAVWPGNGHSICERPPSYEAVHGKASGPVYCSRDADWARIPPPEAMSVVRNERARPSGHCSRMAFSNSYRFL